MNSSETRSLSTTAPLDHASKCTHPAGPVGEASQALGMAVACVWMRLRVCGFLAHQATILEGSLCGQKEVKLSPDEPPPLTRTTSVLLTMSSGRPNHKPEWVACWIQASSVFSFPISVMAQISPRLLLLLVLLLGLMLSRSQPSCPLSPLLSFHIVVDIPKS